MAMVKTRQVSSTPTRMKSKNKNIDATAYRHDYFAYCEEEKKKSLVIKAKKVG